MASEKSFAHISVNSGDDDVVIHAGASQPIAETEEEWEAGASVGDEQSFADDEAPEDGGAAREDGGQAESSAAPVDQSAPAAQSASRKDGYHETTLDDIQGSRMGTTQKVVIGLAIVMIVAIVVWQIAFNG